MRLGSLTRSPGAPDWFTMPTASSYTPKRIRIMQVKITRNPTSSRTTTSLTRAVSASSWTVAVPSGLTGASFILRSALLITILPQRKIAIAAMSATSHVMP